MWVVGYKGVSRSSAGGVREVGAARVVGRRRDGQLAEAHSRRLGSRLRQHAPLDARGTGEFRAARVQGIESYANARFK